MLAPTEVEGEVDHSFFDSDDGGISRDRAVTSEHALGHERLEAKQAEETQDGLSLRENGTKQHLTHENSRSRGDSKDKSHQSKEEETRRQSSASSVASKSHTSLNNSSDSEEDNKTRYKRPTKTFMALLDEANDGDMSTQSPNETEEEASLTAAKHLRRRSKQSPKKLQRKWRTHSPSRTSTEEADSESCSNSGCVRSTPILHKPRRSSLPPRERRARVGSAGSGEMPTSRTEESDDTLTDVSPPSSPDISPLQSLDLKPTEAEEGSLGEQQQHESVPSSGLSETPQDEDSDQDMDECSISSESQSGVRQLASFPGRKNRKNYSFSNTEVRRIDLENQRLLRALSRLSADPRPESAAKKKSNKSSNVPPACLTSSTVNRQREQKRIESENMTFLKRLESVKPSHGMKRADQLADYQRLSSYLGGPVSADCRPSPKKDGSCSRTSSAPAARSAGSTHHGSRAASAASASASSNKQSG